ncbi:MAG: hypothetical protein JSS60_00090 [Verrucomicrobia bacterium]|nr:hypothetical protein [Verrucomicrobiota bacterium]
MSNKVLHTSQSGVAGGLPPVVMVGDARISAIIAEALTKLNVPVETDPLCATIQGEYVFGRDSRVILADGTQLIPYPIQDPLLEGRFKALLPESSNHMITSMGVGYGKGFSKENVEAAHSSAQALHIPAIQASCCIEGGNCFITQSGAIVGVHSVVLSLIALEEQGCFQEEEIQRKAREIEFPDPRFLRMARNSALYAEKRPFDEKLLCARGYSPVRDEISKRWGGETGFRSLMASPLAESAGQKYCAAAKILQAKWELTLNSMAKELGVSNDKLAIVDQNEFHIDMEMALGPDDLLFVHDANGANTLLESLTERARRAGTQAFSYYNKFHQSSIKNCAREFKTTQKNLPKLTSLGLRVITLPASYSCETEKVNFINGLFIKTKEGSIFLTNGACRRANVFVEEFTNSLRGYKIQPIFFDELQEVLTRNHGGLHCLTWTRPVSNEEALDPSKKTQ